MRAYRFLWVFIFIILLQSEVVAQLKSFKSPDIEEMKKEKIINLEFSFDSMAIVDPEVRYKSEEEYIQRKVKEHNEEKPGKGDEWQVEWNQNPGSGKRCRQILFQRHQRQRWFW